MPIVSANNDTIYVAADAGSDGDGSITNPYNSISKALDDVGGEKNTIVLENGTYSEMNINIMKSVNIVGQEGAVIGETNRGLIFNISNTSTVSLTNLTFKNTFTNIIGAAVINSGNLYVDNVKFINNSARASSAIYNEGNLFVINSYFEGNSAFAYDGGAISNMENLTVVNSLFINNIALRNGGAIKHQGNKFKVINSTFIENDVYMWNDYGGAIYIWNSKAEIYNSTFKYNWGGNGGAISVGGENPESSALNVTQCVFENNRANVGTDIQIDNAAVNVNYSKILGGISVSNTSEVNFDYNWWGVNNPDFSEMLTSTKPEIYAVLNLTYIETTVKTGVYWVNTSQIVSEIPQLVGNITINSSKMEGVVFSREYEFNVTEGSNVIVCLDGEVQDITVINYIKTFLTAENVEMYYHDGSRLIAYLKDIDGNPLVDLQVIIGINGMQYYRMTDENGSVSIALNLDSGNYVSDVVFNSRIKKYLSCNTTLTVNILSTIKGNNVVKVFRNDTQYYAEFKDYKGNYLANGTTILFNINGVLYNRTVKENGLAKLNLNLAAGEYILTAYNTVTGEKCSNNITILSKIAENNNLVKYYKNDSQYTVKLIGDNGKAVGAGEKVTFNINGVFYTRTTNASGIAKLSINLPPGDYIITAEYKQCKVANNITVLPILSAKDITMKYRDGTKFTASLVDGQGKPYKGQNIQFNINGVFYNRVTDASGQAKLNINLLAGEYIITSSYNGANIANKITITA